MDMDRAHNHGLDGSRSGVLHGMDVHMVKDGDLLGIVIAILVIAVILWWPRKEGR